MSISKISSELAAVFLSTFQQKLDALNDVLEVLFAEGPTLQIMETLDRTTLELKKLAGAFEQRELIQTIAERFDEPLHQIRLNGEKPSGKCAAELRESVDRLRTFLQEQPKPESPLEPVAQSATKTLSDTHRTQDASAILTAVGQISIWSFHDMINLVSKLHGYGEMLGDLHYTLSIENHQENLVDKIEELALLQKKIEENTSSINRSIERIRVARGKHPAQEQDLRLRDLIDTAVRTSSFSKFSISWKSATIPNVRISQDRPLFECVWINLWHLLAHWLAPETGLRAHCECRIAEGSTANPSPDLKDVATLFIWMEPRSTAPGLSPEIDNLTLSNMPPKHDVGQVFHLLSEIVKSHGMSLQAGKTANGLPLFSLSLPCGAETKSEAGGETSIPATGAPLPKPKTANSQPCILVVDDEKDLRALLELKITRLGFGVVTAENLAEAKNILRTTPVRLVLADLFLSQESGLELLHEVKRGYPNVPFVFLTGANEDDLSPAILTVLTKYANGFLRKPLSSQHLKETLQKYCS